MEENCPCCPNHCEKEHLNCGRGKEYFQNQNGEQQDLTIKEQIFMDLRKCGHALHHKELGMDVLENFSDAELNELHELLSKIVNNEK